MTEPTTAVSYDIIRREIGRELGWPRDPASWTADQVKDAADMIAAGCRSAYYPPSGWQWRFLNINFELELEGGTTEYDLPDDFAALVGNLQFQEEDGTWTSVTIVPDQRIRVREQNTGSSAVSGFPLEASLRWTRPTSSEGTRAVLVVWPEPSGDYTLKGQCLVQPNTVSSSGRYPYGHVAFQECLLNAILMQCERKLGENDGKYANAFRESLIAAQKVDERTLPDTLGYNGDGSDSPWTKRDFWPGRVLYDGV